MAQSDKQSEDQGSSQFLPDFCSIGLLFATVILAELMVFAIVLVMPQTQSISWEKLGLLSLFVQWIALSSIGLLCLLRPWLLRWSDRVAGIASYIIVLLATAAVSEAAWQVMKYTSMLSVTDRHAEFLLKTLAISAILSGISLRVIYLQHQQKIHIQAHAEARIQALQARIRPHFLFNSLNTIAALISSQPRQAEEAVEDLSDLFRASLSKTTQLVTLDEEVAMAKRYVQIEQFRLGDRLQVEWSLQALPSMAMLPVLTLQPLLENAIFHGIELLPAGGKVTIQGYRDGNKLTIIITNPCIPLKQVRPGRGAHMAMQNIRERLQYAFGDKGQLLLVRDDEQCKLEIVFPYRSRP
jgi:two-component system sensor histidine kinase AlgZ